jgi:hypothetical protein
VTGKFYAVLINSGGRPVPTNAVEAKINPDDWLRLHPGQFFVYTRKSAKELWEAVASALDPKDIAVVIEVAPLNGWATVNQTVGDWFAKPRF